MSAGVVRRIPRSALAMSSAMLLVACGSRISADDETASAVCNELRGFDDELVDIVNGSVDGISSMPAEMRAAAIVEGLESAYRAVEAWDTRIDRIELPLIAEAPRIRAQLHDGADKALVELDGQRGQLPTGPIEDREVQGSVGAWFNSIEKVMSVTEPEIFKFDRREFKQAFLDEPDCRNVVQQFVNE